jgi:hypothetical protein
MPDYFAIMSKHRYRRLNHALSVLLALEQMVRREKRVRSASAARFRISMKSGLFVPAAMAAAENAQTHLRFAQFARALGECRQKRKHLHHCPKAQRSSWMGAASARCSRMKSGFCHSLYTPRILVSRVVHQSADRRHLLVNQTFDAIVRRAASQPSDKNPGLSS